MVLGLSVSSVVVIRGAAEIRLEALIALGDPSRTFIIYTVFSLSSPRSLRFNLFRQTT